MNGLENVFINMSIDILAISETWGIKFRDLKTGGFGYCHYVGVDPTPAVGKGRVSGGVGFLLSDKAYASFISIKNASKRFVLLLVLINNLYCI